MDQYTQIMNIIKDADAILIGASNGFSISEGLHIFADNQEFETVFGEFKQRYRIRNILDGMFAKWPSKEVHWEFLSRLIDHYSIGYTGSPNTDALKQIIGNKPYFFVTSNGENHFELAGFDADRIYEIEGNWKYMECQEHCCEQLYEVYPVIEEMVKADKIGKDATDFIPKCPLCGGDMEIHMPQHHFVPYDQEKQDQYQKFVKDYHNKKLVILELGVGWRNQLIKAPFMRLAAQEPEGTYITINRGEIYIPEEIQDKSFGLDGDMTEILKQLAETM
ncbi:MAG: NAD-dependent protein deacetylase, SIR2 family [Anaerostipes sp.]|nr:NAD-dependent protein deacetylase, SIR2 family [Anaerostipes sp.]